MTRSKVAQARSASYTLARFLGDVRAVQRGRVPQRVVNRAVGRGAGRVLRGLWR